MGVKKIYVINKKVTFEICQENTLSLGLIQKYKAKSH